MTLRLTHTIPRLAAVLLLALAAAGAGAADDPAPAKTDRLAAARDLIKASKWVDAIAELKQLGDTGNADWNNLMGYSHRKARTPDLAAAERYYDAALKIDPKHKGALEYSGELFLMKGELARAEDRLAALDKACFLPCDEFKDLKGAIERFKANGNRHVPK